MAGWLLVLLLVVTIVFIVVATARYALHPFLALLAAAYGLGLLAGQSPGDVVAAIVEGFGGTVGGIGIIIAAGTIIGVVLERSGGAQVMADAIIGLVGKARSVMAMSLTGAVVSVPVFCDSGYVVLSPLARSLASRSGRSMATYAVALSMGLYATHVFIPPTPGPIAAAGELDADIGLVILLGLVVTIPVLVTTYLFAVTVGERIFIDPDTVSIEDPSEGHAAPPSDGDRVARPETWQAFLPIVLPIALIALNSLAAAVLGEGMIASFLQFLGNPNTALLLGVAAAFLVTARTRGPSLTQDAVGRALRVAGPIILITGAGGALGSVLRSTPITGFLSDSLVLTSLGIFLPFLLAAALKTAQGSSTVAIVTSAAIIAPLVGSLGLDSATGLALVTLAIGAGSMTVSHANDSFFWVVSQFSGMSTPQAYKLQTVSSGIAGVTGILAIWILSLIL
ncbi:gluconate transporter [Roseivivax halodurans JCM 10272]|uniref:Gluconate transporter n=1 Tax=Roseivivax halodurans JCM 10272 TaxID=1449350 RepID=X7E5P5_9RHOB|nr:GntP family permease [Roseivivax halodurans]ETX11195.1 gluconate transporter [Roseivivax halodurans JCM 10272]